MSVEKNNTQEKTTSFQFNNYLKAGAVSVLTLGAYAIARATNFLPQWRTQSGATITEISKEPESAHLQLQNAGVSVVQSNVDATSLKSAVEGLSSVAGDIPSTGLAEFKEIELEFPQTTSIETQKTETTHQRKLLSQSTVVKPVPDQVINANEIYDYTIDVQEVFGPGMQGLAIVGDFPGWMGPNCYPLLKSYSLPDTVNSVTVVGTKAYVTSGTSGLYILDITNPSIPILLGNYDTPGTATKVVISNNIAYVLDGTTFGTSLEILNVSDPSKPTYLSNYTYLSVTDIALDGNLAYVVDWNLLTLVDVNNPRTPTVVGNGFIPGTGYRVAINSGIAYVATSTGVYSYQDSVAPLRIVSLSRYPILGSAYSVTVAGTTAYIAAVGQNRLLQIINVADPAKPMLLSQYATLGTPYHVAVVGTTAYVAEGSNGIQIINVANPAAPILLGQYGTPGFSMRVAVVGTTAYVAEQQISFTGIQIINVANPAAPTLLGQYATPGYAQDITLVGTTAYVAECFSCVIIGSGFQGLQIINVANPAAPTLIGQYATLGYAASVTVVSTIAYVAELGGGFNGLQIINVANPAAPTLIGQYATLGRAARVTVVGTIAYVAESGNGFNGLQIINVANPAVPTLIGQYTPLGTACDVTVIGTMAYVMDNNALNIINVTNPKNSPLGSYLTSTKVRDISISNNMATVISDFGVQKLSLVDPINPTLLGNTTTLAATNSITQVGATAYVSEGTAGFQIFNTAVNPSTLIGAYDTPGSVTSMTVVGKIGYVADGAAGIQILNLVQARLQGIPGLLNVGDRYGFTVTATDALGNWATDSFTVTVARFPVIFQAIASPNAFWANKPISFTLPQDTFLDPNNESLAYSAALTNQSPLPAWLVFRTNNLTFSGITPNVASLTTFTIQVTAVNPLGGYISATFPLVIQPNVPPTLTNLISTQSASVHVAFKFVIPQGTFIDPEGDALTYRATLSDGSPLPTWLNFDGNTFSGVSGRGDTDFYSTKVLPIFLTATDGKFSTSTTFNINVGGVSGGELFVKIATPLLSAAGFALGVYRKRAFFLNCVNKKKYQRLEETVAVGEAYSRTLDTPVKDIVVVQAKLFKPVSCCPRFFKNTNTKVPIPGGQLLPEWLHYDFSTNSLYSTSGPKDTDIKAGSLVIQVKDKAGVIREEFTLKLAESANALDTQSAIMADDVPLEVLPKGPGKV